MLWPCGVGRVKISNSGLPDLYILACLKATHTQLTQLNAPRATQCNAGNSMQLTQLTQLISHNTQPRTNYFTSFTTFTLCQIILRNGDNDVLGG